jgi:hypothetical protein
MSLENLIDEEFNTKVDKPKEDLNKEQKKEYWKTLQEITGLQELKKEEGAFYKDNSKE